MSKDSVLGYLVWVDVQPDVVLLQVEPDDESQAGFGGSLFEEFFDLLIVQEEFSVNGAVYLREETVFDRVPFGAVRGVMTDDYLDSEFLGPIQEFFFEGMVAMPVGSAAVAKQENVIGVRVLLGAMPVPPPTQVVDDESSGLMGVAKRHKALVLLEVEDAVRDDFAC